MQNPNAREFQFCPFCGQRRLRAACVKSFVCEACRRQFFVNVAGAVAGWITDPDGAVLVTVRKYDPAAGTWDLPGGFLNPQEEAEAGLRREVREELGFDPGQLTYVCSMPNDYPYQGVRYPTVDLLFRASLDARPQLTLDDEIAAALWVQSRDLDPSRFGLASIRRVVEKVM